MGKRVREWWGRARNPGGHERQVLELIVKSTLAASLSWYVAHDLLVARTPAFAPFSAVLIMQVTVYQSLLQALRYLTAVCAGVFVQAGLGFLAGPELFTFVLVALIALTIGRWRHLGEQGTQVATAAFFAFSTYSASTGNLQRVEQLGQIILLVAIGCGIGVGVNLFLWPPTRYRGAEAGIHALARALSDLLADIHPALRAHDFDPESAGQWRQRAADITSLVGQTRSALHTAIESRYYNPRLLLPHRSRHRDFYGYRELVGALERVTHQLGSLTRTLHHWPRGEDGDECRGFLRDCADLLEALGEITRQFGEVEEAQLPRQARRLCDAAERAQEKHSRLVGHARDTSLPLGDPSRPYGVLLVEATRLMDEARYSCDTLWHTVDETRQSAGACDERVP
ncbi:hypothetical protein FM076_30855 [Streptomyces albus subsp. chlorinus]|nr:aromatic acid exporter family protein [Streptomyces albus]NSC25313.1 hypothetical protein [Streptomyces albus subsp. chlorinus]